MLRLAYRALSCDNLQPTTHFVVLFIKHPDLPLPIKQLLAHKLTQKVLLCCAIIGDVICLLAVIKCLYLLPTYLHFMQGIEDRCLLLMSSTGFVDLPF
jgi:hypothetical protein